ncbi:V-type ATP synthase beta chain [subsurface metagenome]
MLAVKEYQTVTNISGPLMLVEMVDEAKYGHIVDIELGDGSIRHGQILQVENDKVLVQVFEGTRGIDVSRSTVRFLAKPLELAVSPDILGRVFSGLGEPKDDGPAIIPDKRLDINSKPINPYARNYPNEFIQTGISSIDGLNPLVRGQKLPIFSGAGLPHRFRRDGNHIRGGTILYRRPASNRGNRTCGYVRQSCQRPCD